ncbi:surface-adhesin E family protein [Sphingomonas guangdongensis]|nr:surface-adhesin E family protein [Sphingomonas guangdongensis]
MTALAGLALAGCSAAAQDDVGDNVTYDLNVEDAEADELEAQADALEAMADAAETNPDPNAWVFVTISNDNSVYKIRERDRQRITGVGSFWTEANHLLNKTVQYRKTKTLNRIDCPNETITLVSFTNYKADGGVLDTDNIPTYQQSTAPIVPDSIADHFMQFVCKP